MKSRKMGWVGYVVCMGEMKNAHDILAGNPEGKRPLGTSVCREDNIIMDLREIRWKGVDWIHLAQDRNQCWAVVNTLVNLLLP
jgi:hypothetical protein